MLKVLRRWATDHRDGNSEIRRFLELAENLSGQPLHNFFRRWLYSRGKPAPLG
jgi:aminopeptidase N